MEDNLEAARICKQYKLSIWANYMLGIPTETKEEAMATVEMIRTIDPDYFSPAFFTPQPGTELGRYVDENGLALQGSETMRRNPDAPKIRGIDYDFLRQALDKSRQRHLHNQVRRSLSRFNGRVRRKIRKIAAGQTAAQDR